MQTRKRRLSFFLGIIAITTVTSVSSQLAAQDTSRPWMNPGLSAEERAELVVKQLTLDEKLALLHGNGMAHNPQWTMPLTHLANGGAGYVEGVPRLGRQS